jgi:hypothetical protein
VGRDGFEGVGEESGTRRWSRWGVAKGPATGCSNAMSEKKPGDGDQQEVLLDRPGAKQLLRERRDGVKNSVHLAPEKKFGRE